MLNDTLKTKIIEHLVSRTGAEDWRVVGDRIDSTDCVVYRLTSPSHAIDIALKLYHQDKSSKKGPHYSAIERFSKLLNKEKSKYKVPNPYGFFEEENCFLMEWATGENLKERLWKNCLFKGKIQTDIKEAFHWLRYYHLNAGANTKQVETSNYADNIIAHCERLKFNELFENNVIFSEGFVALENYSKQFVGYETLHVDIHGDLNLSNIIMGDDHVTGIDIGAKEFAPIENDMAQMLNYICINYFNMLKQIDMRKPVVTWEIFNVVFDAYEYPENRKAREFFLFVFLYQMLLRWVSAKHIHSVTENNTFTFKMLGMWRLHNSAAIVKGLTEVINKRLRNKY